MVKFSLMNHGPVPPFSPPVEDSESMSTTDFTRSGVNEEIVDRCTTLRTGTLGKSRREETR